MTSSNSSALGRFLQRLLRHSRLSQDEQAAILGIGSNASQIDANRDLVVPGQKLAHACLVVDGMIARFDQMRNGERQITALYIAGDMADLQSAVKPVSAWGLQAIATTTVLHVAHGDLRALAEAHPAVAVAFWRDTVIDASVMAKWVANVGRKNALARTAHLLCELGMRMEQADLGSRTDYALPMTQVQLADALGLTPVHINRTLQALRKDDLIDIQQRAVRISDWPGLAQVGEFDPAFLLIEPLPEQEAA